MSRRRSSKMLEHKLIKTTCRSTPFPTGGGGARGESSRSTKESHWRSRGEWWERRLAGRGQAWLLGCQHQLLPGLPCVVEARLPCGAEARLPCVVETAEGRRSRRNSRWFSGCMQMDPGEWSDVSAWFIRALNHVLDRLYFRRDSLVNQMVW